MPAKLDASRARRAPLPAAVMVALILLLAAGCERTETPGPAAEEAPPLRLALSVTPQRGEAPLEVQLAARLEGDIPSEEEIRFRCPTVAWELGNGDTLFVRDEARCRPGEVRRSFSATYTYRAAGAYDVTARLIAREVPVSAPVQVLVEGPTPTPAAVGARPGPTIVIATPRDARPSATLAPPSSPTAGPTSRRGPTQRQPATPAEPVPATPSPAVTSAETRVAVTVPTATAQPGATARRAAEVLATVTVLARRLQLTPGATRTAIRPTGSAAAGTATRRRPTATPTVTRPTAPLPTASSPARPPGGPPTATVAPTSPVVATRRTAEARATADEPSGRATAAPPTPARATAGQPTAARPTPGAPTAAAASPIVPATAVPSGRPTTAAVGPVLPADIYYLARSDSAADAGKGRTTGRRLWRLPSAGSAPVPVTDGTRDVTDYAVATSGALAYVDTAGLHVQRPTGPVRRVHGPDARGPVWSRDGRSLAFAAAGVRVLEREARAPSPPLTEGQPLGWSRGGDRLLVRRPDGSPAVLHVEDGGLTPLPLAPAAFGGWLPDREDVLWLAGPGLRLVTLGDTWLVSEVLDAAVEVSDVFARPDRQLLLLVAAEAGRVPHAIDLTAPLPTARPAGQPLPAGDFAWAPNGRHGALAARDGLWLVDALGGARVPLVEAPTTGPAWTLGQR